jgi:hypothetical protein
MQRLTFAQRHSVLISCLGFSVGLGCLIAFVGQTLAPSLAKLPGLVLCAGGDFELVLRRRTSYGVCAGGAHIHYAIILAVSSLVWAVACSPLGLLFAYLRARRAP